MSMAEAVRSAVQSAPATLTPSTTAEPAPMVAGEPAGSMEAGPNLWHAVREDLGRKFPMQSGYAAEASYLRTEGRQFIIGVPEDHRMAATSLDRPNVKAAIEDILHRFSGQKFVLKVEVSAEVAVAPPPEVSAPAPVEAPRHRRRERRQRKRRRRKRRNPPPASPNWKLSSATTRSSARRCASSMRRSPVLPNPFLHDPHAPSPPSRLFWPRSLVSSPPAHIRHRKTDQRSARPACCPLPSASMPP